MKVKLPNPLGKPFNRENFPQGQFFLMGDWLHLAVSWTNVRVPMCTVVRFRNDQQPETQFFHEDLTKCYFPVASHKITLTLEE